MALYVLVSASGSPGVSTTATGLAYNWPRPVLLVDADPTGSSALLAGHFRGELEPGAGLIDLALAADEGRLEEAFAAAITKLPDSDNVRFLAGVRAHAQAHSSRLLWPQMLTLFRRLDEAGHDVIVDAGRLGLAGSPDELIDRADVVVLLIRNSLVSLAGARSWASTLRARLASIGGAARLALMIVADVPRRVQTYGDGQIYRALQIRVNANLPYDKDTAEVYSHGARATKGFASSALTKAYVAAAEGLRLMHARNIAELEAGHSSAPRPPAPSAHTNPTPQAPSTPQARPAPQTPPAPPAPPVPPAPGTARPQHGESGRTASAARSLAARLGDINPHGGAGTNG